MGKIAEQYLVSQITDLQNVNHTLEKKIEELQKIINSQDAYIGDLEKGHDFLTGLFVKQTYGIDSVTVYKYEKEKHERLMELCGFVEEEGEE